MTNPLRQKKKSTARKLLGNVRKYLSCDGAWNVTTRIAARPRMASSKWKRCFSIGVGCATRLASATWTLCDNKNPHVVVNGRGEIERLDGVARTLGFLV